MQDLYSAKDISEVLGLGESAVYKRADKEGWLFEIEKGRGRGGKKRYKWQGLPRDVKEAISNANLKAVIGGKSCSCPQSMQVRGNGASIGAVSSSRLAIVPDRSNTIGLAKYRLIQEWRKVMDSQPWGKKCEATKAFLAAYDTGKLLPAVYETLRGYGQETIDEKTIYRLDKRLRETMREDGTEDYMVLADGRGGWKKHGTTKWRDRELSREAQEELLRCYLRPNVTVVTAIRGARMLLGKLGHQEASSDDTFRRWLKDFEKRHQHVVVLAREGEKAYRDKVGPYITRDDGILSVGQVLVADGHDLNFTILHPVTGKAVRMKLIVFFDWASRYPAGWQIMPTESTVAISAALRNAIDTLGKYPNVVYLDNGRAFKSRMFTETNPDLEDLAGIYARLGIGTCFAMPYNARSKVVERFFLTLSEQCEAIIPTYCGGSIKEKPPWMLRNEKLHKAWQEARTKGWVPTVRDACHMLSVYFRWYSEQPHDGLGGRRPIDVFDAGRGPGVDVTELNAHFLWRKRVKPRHCRVTLYGIEYESDCLHGYAEDVIACHDMADLNCVWLYTLSGEYLGSGLPVEALHPLAKLFGDQVSVDQVKAELTRQRRLAKQTRKNLEELGATKDDVESVRNLPWNRKVALIEGGKPDAAPEKPDAADEERKAQLELVYSRVSEELDRREEVKAAPAVEVPEFFPDELSHYDWAFKVRFKDGLELPQGEAEFMAYFEKKPEFSKHFRQRYEDLRELYALQG